MIDANVELPDFQLWYTIKRHSSRDGDFVSIKSHLTKKSAKEVLYYESSEFYNGGKDWVSTVWEKEQSYENGICEFELLSAAEVDHYEYSYDYGDHNDRK